MHLAQHGWDRDSASAININNYHLTWLKSHPPKIWSYWRCFIVLFTRLYQMIKNPFDTPGKSPNLVCSPSRCFTAQKRHAELQICTRRAGPQSPTQLVQPPWKIWVCEEKEGTPKWLFDTICCENMWKLTHGYNLSTRFPSPYFHILSLEIHGIIIPWIGSPMIFVSSHRFHSCRLQAVQKSVRLQQLTASRRVWLLTIGADHQQNPSAGYPWFSQRCGVVVTVQNYRQDVVSLWSRSWQDKL